MADWHYVFCSWHPVMDRHTFKLVLFFILLALSVFLLIILNMFMEVSTSCLEPNMSIQAADVLFQMYSVATEFIEINY